MKVWGRLRVAKIFLDEWAGGSTFTRKGINTINEDLSSYQMLF